MSSAQKPVFVVLGASSDQLFMIRTAQEMGFAVLAIDMNPDSPGRQVAEHFAAISTHDVAAITAYFDECRAGGMALAGVSTMGSDIPHIVTALAEHLGTPAISRESAELATDKLRMKERFAACGVPIPWFREIGTFQELQEIIRSRGISLVIKPNDRSGSRGVFLLDEACDIEDLFNRTRAFSYSDKVLVEEFLPGPQISTETIMVDGRAHTPGFADRNYDLLDRFRPQIMENGGWVPSLATPEEKASIESLVEQASLALGVTDGVTKGDVVLTADGPKMIEMAARLSGGDFCAGLVPLGTGVNYVKTVIQLAVGQVPDLTELTPRKQIAVANRYFFPQPGKLVRIEGADTVAPWDWVKKLEFWYQPGDEVPQSLSHAHRFGVFLVVAEDRDELEKRISRVYETINVITEPV